MYRLIDVVRAARARHGDAERMRVCQLSKAASAKHTAKTRVAASSQAGAQKVWNACSSSASALPVLTPVCAEIKCWQPCSTCLLHDRPALSGQRLPKGWTKGLSASLRKLRIAWKQC